MPMPSLCDRALVVFNFFPSMTLHPSRIADYGGAPFQEALAATPGLSATWHRHWSWHILRQEGLAECVVTDAACPGLALAVLSRVALAALARCIGAVLCAPRLRYAISGQDVRALRDALGADVLRLARDGGAIHPGLQGPMFVDAADAVAAVDATGYAVLHVAFQEAPLAVARRLFLKMPASSPGRPSADGVASMDGDTAMALATTLGAPSPIGGADAVPA